MPAHQTLFMVVVLPEKSEIGYQLENFLQKNKMPCMIKEENPQELYKNSYY